MATRSNLENLAPVTSIVPLTSEANTDREGDGVDLRGYDSATALIVLGAIHDDVTGKVKLEHRDSTDGVWADVDEADIVDPYDNDGEFAVAAAAENGTYQLGYLGSLRYVRAVLHEVAGGDTGKAHTVGVSIVRGHPHFAPATKAAPLDLSD